MMIVEKFTTGPLQTNAYILACSKTKQACVIDVPLNSSSLIVNGLKKHSLTLIKVLFTHAHVDHVADAALLKETCDAPFLIHELDAEGLILPGKSMSFAFPEREGVHPDGVLKDGDVFFVGELEIHVLFTPGHSPGAVCFYLPKEGVLFSGDTLFRGTMGRVDLPHSNPSDMWISLKKLAKLPAETKVFPGHGPETTIENERWMATAEDRWN